MRVFACFHFIRWTGSTAYVCGKNLNAIFGGLKIFLVLCMPPLIDQNVNNAGTYTFPMYCVNVPCTFPLMIFLCLKWLLVQKLH